MRGYVRLPKKILELSLSPKAIKLFSVISALYYANCGKAVKISVKSLSAHTALSEASVTRALNELRERDVIACSKTYYDGKRQSNRYRVCLKNSDKYILLDLSLVMKMCSEKLVIYLVLCSHANRQGYSYISERALAHECGISRTTIRKYTAELEADGELQKYMRFYQKHKLTKAKRCFAYLISEDTEKAIPTDILPTQDTAIESKENNYLEAVIFCFASEAYAERIFPLRVPP